MRIDGSHQGTVAIAVGRDHCVNVESPRDGLVGEPLQGGQPVLAQRFGVDGHERSGATTGEHLGTQALKDVGEQLSPDGRVFVQGDP